MGTHLRRDTLIPQWFQVSKAAAASDGHAAVGLEAGLALELIEVAVAT